MTPLALLLVSARSRIALVLTLAGCCGCSSVPSAVESADNVMVAYYGFRENEQSLALVNETNPQVDHLRKDEGLNVKQAPRDLLDELIDRAAAEGFFDYAIGSGSPDEMAGTEAKAMLVVEADDKPYTMILAPGKPESNRAFTVIQLELMRLFRDIPSMQVMEGQVDGASFFERENQKLQQNRSGVLQRSGARP